MSLKCKLGFIISMLYQVPEIYTIFLYWVSLSLTNVNEFLPWSKGFWNTNIILRYMYLRVVLIPIPDDFYLKYTLLPELTMFSLLVACKNSLGSLDFCLVRWGKIIKILLAHKVSRWVTFNTQNIIENN